MVALPHVGVLKTDGGPHPADMWAEASANEIANIVVVEDQSITDAAKKARKAKPRFALDLADVLEDWHQKVQDKEKAELKAKGVARLGEDHGIEDMVEGAVKDVLACADKTMFAAQFKASQVVAHVKAIVSADMNTVAHIEQSWFADNNLHDPKAKAFKAAKHTGWNG